MKKYVLDACALIAVLNKEPGAELVKKLLEQPQGETKIYMNIVNLLEVYYGLLREYGADTARNILTSIKSSPIILIDTITEPVFVGAAKLKSKYKLSLADSFALAEGIANDAAVITSDHHEFDKIEKSENIAFLWIR